MIDAEMYGMMLRANIVMRLQRAAREHVEHVQDAAGMLLEDVRQDVRIDARQRDIGAEPRDDQVPRG